MTDALDEVRSLARARASEDFYYFATHVLGVKLSHDVCRAAQSGMVPQDEKARNAYSAWLAATGRGPKLGSAPTETFLWLFFECVEERAA